MKYIRGLYSKRLGRKLAGDEVSKEDLAIMKTLNIDVSRYTDTKQKQKTETAEAPEVVAEAAPKKRTRKKKASE